MSTPKFNAWRLAEHRAQVLERDMQAAAMLYPPMSSSDWCEMATDLRLRRRVSQDAFTEAMLELRSDTALLGRDQDFVTWSVQRVAGPRQVDREPLA